MTNITSHLKALGLKDLREYKDWCIFNQLSTNPNKNNEQIYEEVKIANRQKAIKNLKKAKKNRKNSSIVQFIEDYFN